MRAVRIEAFGEPADVLEHVEMPEPPLPAAGEMLIGVELVIPLEGAWGFFPLRAEYLAGNTHARVENTLL